MRNFPENENNNSVKLLGLLGLCVNAGKAVLGTAMICDAMRNKNKILLVIEAADTSENTHKRLSDKCAYYGVRHVRVNVSMLELSHKLGRSSEVSSIGITDKNFLLGIEKLL